jgi:hypothetical protein
LFSHIVGEFQLQTQSRRTGDFLYIRSPVPLSTASIYRIISTKPTTFSVPVSTKTYKMYQFTMAAVWIISLLSIALATPVVRQSLNPNPIAIRSPITNEAFSTDWPTNFLMVGGSQTYGGWVPEDGNWYNFANILCLGMPAYALGDCNDITVDHIGVVAGNGPCSFTGSAGLSVTLQGTSGEGYYTVGPPQRIISAKCG